MFLVEMRWITEKLLLVYVFCLLFKGTISDWLFKISHFSTPADFCLHEKRELIYTYALCITTHVTIVHKFQSNLSFNDGGIHLKRWWLCKFWNCHKWYEEAFSAGNRFNNSYVSLIVSPMAKYSSTKTNKTKQNKTYFCLQIAPNAFALWN